MATIKAIESRSIHQIQSGQVIVDLISVVKELVENSLDAGATSVDVRLKNHGLDSIEVQDNGKGIAPSDYDTIALKHYTSKLATYEDLDSLDTFGFRGEALSSLCALSNFHIVTATAEDGAVGKKLDFEVSGKLRGASVVAAQRGTTVYVENLFGSLPVRRRELEKNIKREYNKALSHLYAYACICVGVRFSVSNQMPKAKKTLVFSTKANTTTKENIVNVFGAKTLSSLVQLDLRLQMAPSQGPSTQSARNWATQARDRSMEVRVEGHISKPVFGEGRQAPDRQMFFVNSRPSLLPQVTKAFNEVYKSFNVSQTPFIFANLVMDTNSYDVNVSPDKRSIMLHDQAALLETLKASLTELFESSEYSVPQSQLQNRKLPAFKPLAGVQRPAREGSPNAYESDSDSEQDETRDTAFRDAAHKIDAASTPPSLIHDWVGQDTAKRINRVKGRKYGETSSDEKHKGFQSARLIHEDATDDQDVGDVQDEFENDSNLAENREVVEGSPNEADVESDSQVEEGSFIDTARKGNELTSPEDPSAQKSANLLKRVEDFKALMERKQAPDPESPPEAHAKNDSEQPAEESPEVEMRESEIPSIARSSQKPTPGPIQNAFDRMRPRRTPLQTAEITVGQHTTTAVVGSGPPYKKRRIYQPVNSQSIGQFGGSPLIARGLRSFAAPGSLLEVDSSDVSVINREEVESSEDEIESRSVEATQDAFTERVISTGDPDSGEDDGEDAPSSDTDTSNNLDAMQSAPADDDAYDDDYVDENEKKRHEDEKVARLIEEAEMAAAQPSEENLRRASQVLKNTGNRKGTTLQLAHSVPTSIDEIRQQSLKSCQDSLAPRSARDLNESGVIVKGEIDASNAESRLSLIVSKSDFERMKIVGQFNLGFILAIRPSATEDDEDQLFIIDQHAADEKYNYERLQRTVTLQNQRLVRPKPLDLTAVEEEIILNNTEALKANGFEIDATMNGSDDDSVERTFRLVTLPMSREKTFEISDLEELLHLLSEAAVGGSEIPRPKKVQSMLAMRACRSSIMVGKTLTLKQMQKVVSHMGEMEKPWNCPHGRPTMRHLAGLGAWNSWVEGDVIDDDDHSPSPLTEGRHTDWASFLQKRS